jgi:hypothetical protein
VLDDYLITNIVVWSKIEPWLAYSSDGRLMMFDKDHQPIIMPAPAYEIWVDIQARKLARAQNLLDKSS